jgi:hypothetical protein
MCNSRKLRKRAVLYSAPPIPAGIRWNPQEWDRNPQEWDWNPQEWTGIRRNSQEWDWNRTGKCKYMYINTYIQMYEFQFYLDVIYLKVM